MKKYTFGFLLGLLFSLQLAACGGGGGSDGSGIDPSAAQNQPEADLGQTTNLIFKFSVQVAAPSDATIPPLLSFPQFYSVPLHIKPNGEVTMIAREFPTMILRICPSVSNLTGCTVRSDDDQVGEGIDLVMDLCKHTATHAACGTDATQFHGSLTDDGSLSILAIDVRARVFLLGSGPDGKTAKESDGGFMADLPRMTVAVHTDRASSGALTADGLKVTDTEVRLVSAGLIPKDMPEIGKSSYLSILEGHFTVDPLDFLE